MGSNFRATEIHPKHWRVAQERATVLQQYCALQNPSVADVDAAAAKLGLKRRAFYYLLARMRISTQEKARRPDPGADLQRASRKTLLRRNRERSAASLHELDADLVIAVDHAPLELAIAGPREKVAAYLSAVIDRRNGRIIGHYLGSAPPSAQSAAAALLHWCNRGPGLVEFAARQITMNWDHRPDWKFLARTIRSAGYRCRGRRARRLPMGAILFERMTMLASIPMRPRMPSSTLLSRICELPSVTLDEARSIVAEAIEKWNLGRSDIDSLMPSAAFKAALDGFCETNRLPFCAEPSTASSCDGPA